MKRILGIALLVCISVAGLVAEVLEPGSIKGYIIEKSTGSPLEFATIIVKNKKDSIYAQSVTDKNGLFNLKDIPKGEYKLSYSFIGYDKSDSVRVVLPTAHSRVDLGKLYISETTKSLGQVDVIGQRSTFVNSIDRKTFNVGQDLMSKSGSVSDLMQNIPSVQVDIDGNVSLRGSENVTILVDGKPSAMMNLNRAVALQQMPASSIEKIEIITNPSAKYKPDGTSGIINIVLKKNKTLGLNGVLTANVGNNGRRNFNVLANYNPGKLNIFGSFGMREDNRVRLNDLTTTSYDSLKVPSYSKTYSVAHANQLSYIGNAGFDYTLNKKNQFGASINVNSRYQVQYDSSKYSLHDNLQNTLLDYNRDRRLPELESDIEVNASYSHKFGKEGHELNVSYISSFSKENEDNYYTNTYRFPIQPVGKDNMFYHHLNNESELAVEYTLPITKESKFEAGYLYQHADNDMDLKRDTLQFSTNSMVNDVQRSSHFIRSENTHVLYATYEQELGNFGFLAGVRGEQTNTTASLVTLSTVIPSQYFRLYPTLHTSYKLSDIHELQLNYSHRIRRPDDEDLNPFPEYQDMRNIRAGNPYLKPEDIHSFELGYQFKKDVTTFLSTLYYRNAYNMITGIITNLGNDVFKSSLQNLDRSQSAGLELILSSSIGKIINFNLATNAFYNTIDASALGYSNHKSTVSWSANGNVSCNLTKSTVWQVTSNYSAESLTPQGKRLPSFVLNTALKQELFKKKAALILTVSDVFNSMKSNYILDTPDLYRTEIRRRSAQTIYLGFTWSFGSTPKKSKENAIKFDNQL